MTDIFGPPVKSRIVWRSMVWLPYHFGFCPDEKAWHADIERLGLPPDPYPKSDGSCTPFTNEGLKGGGASIVTIANNKKRSGTMVVELLAHESVHVFDHLCAHIGEKAPSKEFNAYAMQYILGELMAGYEKSGRGKILR